MYPLASAFAHNLQLCLSQIRHFLGFVKNPQNVIFVLLRKYWKSVWPVDRCRCRRPFPALRSHRRTLSPRCRWSSGWPTGPPGKQGLETRLLIAVRFRWHQTNWFALWKEDSNPWLVISKSDAIIADEQVIEMSINTTQCRLCRLRVRIIFQGVIWCNSEQLIMLELSKKKCQEK